MCHNLLTTEKAGDLFPLRLVAYDDCSRYIQENLRQDYPNEAAPGTIFHPMQATTPIGFPLSVVLAHVCMQRCNETSYAELVREHPHLDDR